MIPDTLGAVVAFLLLTAPGSLYYLLRSRHVPTTKETQLAELSRVVLASLMATAGATALLSWFWVSIYRDLDERLPALTVYTGAAVVTTAALACGLVALWVWWRWGRRGAFSGRIQAGRLWYQGMVAARPTATIRPYLTIELLDGTVWKGTYFGQDADPEDSHRNLGIMQPGLTRRRAEASDFVAVRSELVLLPEAQIISIQVTYLVA